MYEYAAKLNRVVDGDTVDLDVDLGFTVWVRIRVRLARIDAPEKRGEEREEGKASTEALTAFLETSMGLVLVSRKSGKYGRWIGEISALLPGGVVNVSDWMVENGWADYYGAKKP
jgi:micrococcal nuclease